MSAGEKRGLNKDHAYQNEVKKPRPFTSEVLSALQKDLLHGLSDYSIETLIRPIVAEEIERAISSAAAEGRVPLKQMTEPPARELYLQFSTNPKAENFTGSKLEGENGDTIRVKLTYANTGQLVTTGPGSDAQFEVVPLVGDFNMSNEQEWTAEEFEKHVAKERDDRGPLLVGVLKFYLKGGVGTLNQMSFTDNSSWTRSKKFRLGVKVAQDNGGHRGLTRIREGISQAFTVKDIRGIVYRKHDIPSPSDQVWRLRHIRKDGPYHTKLMQHRIHTVKDFLVCKQAKSELLKEVLGKMSAKAYQDTIDHAEKCVLGEKMYCYTVNQTPYETVLFNHNYQAVGAVAQEHYVSLDTLNDDEKVQMDSFVKEAYEHWGTNVTEYTIEDLTTVQDQQAIMPPPEDVDGFPADMDMEFTDIQESNDYFSGNAMAAWTLQEQGHGFDHGCSRQNLTFQPFYTEHLGFMSSIADEQTMSPIIASAVRDVMEEYKEDPHIPSRPAENRWWLRIRTVVRCALFIRKAGSDRQQQLGT